MLTLLCSLMGTTAAMATPKDDLTAGDATNAATFNWSGKTLTITGKGDLSKVTVKDESKQVFSAAGAGQIYTAQEVEAGTGTSTVYTAVKQGDTYDANTTYYQASYKYTEQFNGATTPSTIQYVYTVASKYVSLVEEGKAIYHFYFGTGSEPDASGTYVNYPTVIINGTNTTFSEDGGVYVDGSYYTDWNNTQTQNGNTYYYYFVADNNLKNGATFKLSEIEDKGIVLLTPENRSTYVSSVVTVTPQVNNLFSKLSGSDDYLARTSAWQWTEGETIYTGSSSVGATGLISDNAEFFGTTHPNYLEAATMTFAQYLPYAVAELGCSTTNDATVIIKTERGASEIITDNTKLANLNNEITRALVKISDIETLNLQDTYLAELKNVDNSKETDPTFYTGSKPGTWEQGVPNNETLKTLYMPCTDTETLKGSGTDGETNRLTVFHYLTALKNLRLGEGIKTLGENAIYENSTYMRLETLTFPNSLEKAEANCMNGQTGVLTLTFPKDMKTIERHAFWGTNPKDVYFLGTKAPQVAAFAWGENNYISNNAMTNDTIVGDTPETSIKISKSTGVAVRQNYETRNGWYAMLHYPAACTKAEAARYTDLTRDYKKIVYGVENETFKAQYTEDGKGISYYYYVAGEETEDLKGKGQDNDAGITGNIIASTYFMNRYPLTSDPLYGGDYTGGYEDYYVGSQYIWPSMSQSQRAIIVAENCVLWNGVSSIGDGIRTYESDFTGDGSEYIGLHQFVFTQADVTTDKTDEWDVSKYADGKWHSLCLPFSVTKAKLKETFGPNAEGVYNYHVCKFNKVDRSEKKLKLYFNETQYSDDKAETDTIIKAHVPYMVKLKKEGFVSGQKVVLTNYVLEAGSPVPTNVTVTNETTDEDGQYYFIGQYAADITIPQYSYFFSKSRYAFSFQTGTTGKWSAYSAIVEAPNGEEDNTRYFSDGDNQAKLSTIWDDSETTGIEKVTIVAGDEVVYTNDNVYNLNGQLVSTNGKQGLAKGIYVQNGKKFIVK